MRLWSLHPSYLDQKGLVAVWREGLLALKVLSGKTHGYTRHPQLIRFANHSQPLLAINAYLHGIVDEADKRNYRFNREKLQVLDGITHISVTTGQVLYESQHLKKKLQTRDPARLEIFESQTIINPHPLFTIVEGKIEEWERVNYKEE